VAETEKSNKLTIVVFSGELDRALAAFMLATTGASMGMEVTMFFTFWGLNIIKKNEGSLKSRGFLRKMFNVINRGGSKRLKPSKFHMFGMGTWAMKKLMKEVKMPSLEELMNMAQEMGVKMIPCSTSCGLFGLEEGGFRPGVMDIAGAAYFLGEASDSRVVLFI